jgi:DMSO/TMAO reductase YedYZ molybdopterin-dependent catalytic subunit
MLGLGTLGLGFGISVFDGIYQHAEAATQGEAHELVTKGSVNFMGFTAREITPNRDFYITTYSSDVPSIDAATHTLRVEGLVGSPRALTMKEIEAMQDKREFVTLECIGNPVGGDAIGNALWEGVSLKRVLEMAAPRDGIVKTVLYAGDGYSDSIPYELSQSGDVFLAYRMNGEPLPRQHGYPLRLIVPGIYGMKNVKWLSKIELVNYDFKGYWEKRGWSDSAVIPIMSEILMPMEGKSVPPGHYVVGGIAFAGRHGIGRVQVSLDGGDSWRDAEIRKPLSKWAWTLWRFDWQPSREGRYTLKVRGIDRSGRIQESGSLAGSLFGTYPDGARGIHSVHVVVP